MKKKSKRKSTSDGARLKAREEAKRRETVRRRVEGSKAKKQEK